MGMLLTCSNKGCYSQDYHKLDKDSNDVICVSCGGPVEVTKYVKASLLSQGQIIKKAKSTLESKCPSCGSVEGPALLKYSKAVFKVGCKACKEVNVHLTKYFLGALKLKGDIETIDMTAPVVQKEPDAIVKTADGVVLVNKPIVFGDKSKKGVASKASAADGDLVSLDDRAKIEVPKKSASDAAKLEAKLRKAFKTEKVVEAEAVKTEEPVVESE